MVYEFIPLTISLKYSFGVFSLWTKFMLDKQDGVFS